MKNFSSLSKLNDITFFSTRKKEKFTALGFLMTTARPSEMIKDCYEQIENFEQIFADDLSQVIDGEDTLEIARDLIDECKKDKKVFEGDGDREFFRQKKNKTDKDYFVHRYIRKALASTISFL